jgi:dihydrolipoamide dehydrogenase
VVARFVSGVEQLFVQNKVTLIKGTATVNSPTSVRVEPSGEIIQAKNIIVAAGGFTRSLPNVAIDGVNVITSREALELRDRPASIIIVGGGAIGVEFGYLYRSYGAQVTIVEVLPRILPNEDEDVSRQLNRSFTEMGIAIKTSTKVEEIKSHEGGVSVTVSSGDKTETLEAEKVLIGIGFGPNTEKLGLDKVGVTTNRGWIEVDDYCQTNVPSIWAIGDVTGKLLLAHVASHQGVTAVEKIAGLTPPPLEYVNIPRAVYCQPQVASLGLTEGQAKEQGYEVRSGRFPFRANGKSMAIGENDGFVKIVSDRQTGQILGFHAIGHGVTEMLGEATMTALLESTNVELGYAVHAHPTMSEAIKEAALAVTGEAIHFYSPKRE